MTKQISELFERYVPEIASGVVKIMAIARDEYWTKVAVHAMNPEIDSVRACVGDEGGSRIKKIVDELGGPRVARVDIIRWNESLQVMIRNALEPAQIEEAFLYPRLGRAIVLVKEDQLSEAIGDDAGRNVRLASKLLGWDIELLTPEELNGAIHRAQKWFRKIPGITDELLELFIEEGFLSYDDLTFLESAQLVDMTGISEEQAGAIILFAEQAAERLAKEESEGTPSPARPWWKFWA